MSNGDRFEVHGDEGRIECFCSLELAFDAAVRHAHLTNRPVQVYDSMARPREPEVWEVGPDGTACITEHNRHSIAAVAATQEAAR